MRWWSHCAIAGSVSYVVAPTTIPAALLGATAPDWLEWALKAGGLHVRHRAGTHVLAVWATASALFAVAGGGGGWLEYALAFCLGGLSHVLADSATVTGVPLTPWSDRRFHLFGGRLRTGQPGEYLIAGAFLAAAFFAAPHLHPADGFSPWFYDWSRLYRDGHIDASEWRSNRFRLM